MSFVEAGFWFLLGFVVASWLAYRQQQKRRARTSQALGRFGKAFDQARRHDVKITITDRDGDLELESEEDPPAATSSRRPKDLH